MKLEFFIIMLAVVYLRKFFRTSVTMPDWNKKLLWLLYASIALAALQLFYSKYSDILQWISIILLSGLLYIVFTNEKFKPAIFLITAIAPYLLVTIVIQTIKLVNDSAYSNWYNVLDTAKTFTVIWGCGTWFVTKRQRKELDKAQLKATEQEQNNKVITAMKAELEVQVAERTAELTNQKNELEAALDELKSTQSQLVQAEKMASLGELTAGIAHEIQNPLNFVNNFSEVNTEMLEELKAERLKPEAERDENLEKELMNDITQNLEKIAHHGKRADAIVKGMLQHSRKNTGVKEPTDINALCDEYLRLSYHGLRAKDKSFNALFKTDFDESIGKINIIPQDIGRVFLNLFNNAFYATSEKQKAKSLIQSEYKPLVSVQTKKINNTVKIIVKDNGNGIPQNIIDKIFQPFFTTKPTGQGTGLGLSLSYDIIKAHGGELKVESKEGEGTNFQIVLPINK